MTKIQHPMHQFAVRMLAALISLSLLSMLGMMARIYFNSEMSSPLAASANTTAGVHQAVALSAENTTANLASKPLKTPQNSKNPAIYRAIQPLEKTRFEKTGGTPSVEQAIPPLKLRETAERIEVRFDTRALSHQARLRILSRLFLLPQAPTIENLLAQRGVPLLQLPYYYGRVLDGEGHPIRYPYQAVRYAQALLADSSVQNGVQRVVVPLHADPHRAKARPWRTRLSTLHQEEQALLLAIMEVESGFNPKARSRTGAIGLMQLKPDQAVVDVANTLGRSIPAAALYDAGTNVKVGAHYVRLLQNRYLAQIQNPVSREYLTIAAYNGGINAVLRQFGQTRAAAIKRINQLSPQTVYRILRYQFPRAETRHYLEKVVQAKTRYQHWIENNVI